MFFRCLYRRRVVAAFGKYLTPGSGVAKVMATLSEWDCFKLLLPRPAHRLFFTPAMSELVRYE